MFTELSTTTWWGRVGCGVPFITQWARLIPRTSRPVEPEKERHRKPGVAAEEGLDKSLQCFGIVDKNACHLKTNRKQAGSMVEAITTSRLEATTGSKKLS